MKKPKKKPKRKIIWWLIAIVLAVIAIVIVAALWPHPSTPVVVDINIQTTGNQTINIQTTGNQPPSIQVIKNQTAVTVEEVSAWLQKVPQGWDAEKLSQELENRFGLETKILQHEGVDFLFAIHPSWNKWYQVTFKGLLEPPAWFVT